VLDVFFFMIVIIFFHKKTKVAGMSWLQNKCHDRKCYKNPKKHEKRNSVLY
jgi:hypothetical protein